MNTIAAKLGRRLGILLGIGLCLAMLGAQALSAEGTGPLPLDDIIELKRMGFPEATIKQEVSDAAGSYALDTDTKARLRQAGFSDAFIEFLASLQTTRRIDNEAVTRMLRQEMPLSEILTQIKYGKRAFDTAPLVLLDLHKRYQAPKWLLRAMRGQPLRLDEIEALGRERVPAEQQ
jgi:hypothetical protein